MNVRTIPAASDDVVEAIAWVERQLGSGDALDAEFKRAVVSIAANPRMYARTEDGPDEPENREYFIARFEYRVIYAIWKEEAVIVAVIHARRRAGSWRGRLTELV